MGRDHDDLGMAAVTMGVASGHAHARRRRGLRHCRDLAGVRPLAELGNCHAPSGNRWAAVRLVGAGHGPATHPWEWIGIGSSRHSNPLGRHQVPVHPPWYHKARMGCVRVPTPSQRGSPRPCPRPEWAASGLHTCRGGGARRSGRRLGEQAWARMGGCPTNRSLGRLVTAVPARTTPADLRRDTDGLGGGAAAVLADDAATRETVPRPKPRERESPRWRMLPRSRRLTALTRSFLEEVR